MLLVLLIGINALDRFLTISDSCDFQAVYRNLNLTYKFFNASRTQEVMGRKTEAYYPCLMILALDELIV